MPAFPFPTRFSFLLLFGAGLAEHNTCAFVEVVSRIDESHMKSSYLAPGHCERIVGDSTKKSRRFSCYSGCGGTKMQYQEFDDTKCEGNMVVDKMLHRPDVREDHTWTTGPQTEDSYLMNFDLGWVKDFDCGLAFCYVEEEFQTPTAQVHRHVPADRVSCVKTDSGYQWHKCVNSNDLAVFEHPEECDVPQEPEVLGADQKKTSWNGVVRDWDCEGFDNEEEEEVFVSSTLLKAQRAARKSAHARRELSLAKEEEKNKTPDDPVVKVLTLMAVCALPCFVMMAYRAREAKQKLKNLLPRHQTGPRYEGLPQCSDEEFLRG